MNKLISTTALIVTLLLSSCGGGESEYTKPSIEGKWTVNDRFLTSEQNDEETIKFTQRVNIALKNNAKDDYRIEKTYRRIGETEEKGLVGDIHTKYIALKEGWKEKTITNEFELKNDTISIIEDNLKHRGSCNIGDKILIIKRKVGVDEIKKILLEIGLIIVDEIPDGYTATYTTYEIR